jgi:hypothetical protein
MQGCSGYALASQDRAGRRGRVEVGGLAQAHVLNHATR